MCKGGPHQVDKEPARLVLFLHSEGRFETGPYGCELTSRQTF
jgi:hypothetical protein